MMTKSKKVNNSINGEKDLASVIRAAIRSYDDEIKAQPDEIKLYVKRLHNHMRLAEVYMKTEKTKAAKLSFMAALADCEHLAKHKYELFDVYVNIGLIKEKLAFIERSRGQQAASYKLLEEAVDSHTKAIKRSSTKPSAYFIRGNVRQSLAYIEREAENYEAAEKFARQGIRDYNMAIKHGENEAYALRGAAHVLLSTSAVLKNDPAKLISLFRQAIRDYDLAIEHESAKPHVIFLRGEAKGMLADVYRRNRFSAQTIIPLLESSIADYEAEVMREPHFYKCLHCIAHARYVQAETELSHGRFEAASAAVAKGLEVCDDALQICSEDAATYYEQAFLFFLQAAVFEKQDKLEESAKSLKTTLENWDKAIKVAPERKDLKKHRASAARTLAAVEEAKIHGRGERKMICVVFHGSDDDPVKH